MPLQSKVPPIYRFMMSVAGFFPATVFYGCFIKKAACHSTGEGNAFRRRSPEPGVLNGFIKIP